MKYLKTNEGLFSKDEIPKKLIDDIKASIETKYPVTIKRAPAEERRGIFDRITFTTDTPIGNINSVITLQNPYIRTETVGAVATRFIESKFSRKILKFDVYHGKTNYVNSDSKLSDWKNIDVTSVIHNIDYVIQRVIAENKQKKELAEFYGKITEGEIKDLAADLYDIVGDYTLSKTTVKGKKGFQLLFVSKFDFIHKDNNYDRERTFYRATDKHIEILSEINSLSKRLNDGYNLNLIYEFANNTNLRLLIYERSKK